MTQLITRPHIMALEQAIKAQPQVPMPVTHHFDAGVYQRVGVLTADTVATGAIHRYASTFILAKGELLLLTEDGPIHIHAPYATVSPPGTKRVMYAITDCTLIAVLETDLTTPEEVEAAFVVNSYDDL